MIELGKKSCIQNVDLATTIGYLLGRPNPYQLNSAQRDDSFRLQAAARFKQYQSFRERETDFYQYYFCRPTEAPLRRNETGSSTKAVADAFRSARRGIAGYNRLARVELATDAQNVLHVSSMVQAASRENVNLQRRDDRVLEHWNLYLSIPVRSATSHGVTYHEAQTMKTQALKQRYRAETNMLIGDLVGKITKRGAEAAGLFN